MTPKEGQQQLKIVKNVVPINPGEPAPVEHSTGQTQLFNVQSILKPLEDMFGVKLESLETQNKALTGQINRLGTTVAGLVTKLDDKVVHGKDADLVIAAEQDPERADIATVNFAPPAEAYYPYTTSDLAQPVGIHASRLGYLFKLAKIQGDPKYHCAVKTGTTNHVQKYRGTAIKALYDAAVARKVPEMKLGEIQKLEKYFELQRAMAEYD